MSHLGIPLKADEKWLDERGRQSWGFVGDAYFSGEFTPSQPRIKPQASVALVTDFDALIEPALNLRFSAEALQQQCKGVLILMDAIPDIES